MTQSDRLAHLLEELARVGVDPNTLSAGLAVRPEEALQALSSLPDGAGPTAFLAQLRHGRAPEDPVPHADTPDPTR